MLTVDFDYPLPDELIAQHPTAQRDASRLLVLDRRTEAVSHRAFGDLPTLLHEGDLLVFNNSRVIPARLRGRNAHSGGRFEILLTEEVAPDEWWAMLKPGRRAQPGTEIILLDHGGAPAGIAATVLAVNEEGHRRLRFAGTQNLSRELERLGETPLPPYIRRPAGSDLRADDERYQTVYAQPPGSLAAPTAGLHFTPQLLASLTATGIQCAFLTLHVGLGTFAPVKAERLEDHTMHEERFEVSEAAAATIAHTRTAGGRIVAVGTTTVRVLESVAARHDGAVVAGEGRTRIFLHPPAQFRVVDALLTNFHLPCSTLLMLVSAFASPGGRHGRDLILHAYAEAVRERYRFFSYGDAMFLV